MTRRLVGLAGALALLLPVVAQAQTSSSFPFNLLPDNRKFSFTIPNATTYYFFVNHRVGNSYSLEVVGDFPFGWPQGAANITAVTTVPGLVHTQTKDPIIFSTGPGNNVGDRVSWTVAAVGSGFDEFSITNNTGGSVSLIASASDTTLFSSAWSTNGSYDTFYSLYNTTSAACNGTLTLYNTAGTAVTTASLAIPSGATTATNTSALATPRNLSGTAKFSSDCPPGGMLAEAAIANFTITPTPYFQFVHFEAVRGTAH
jgi:hypothetical protein